MAEALKVGIGAAPVPRMVIMAQGVALPDFHPGPAERASLLVQDSTKDMGDLALSPLCPPL